MTQLKHLKCYIEHRIYGQIVNAIIVICLSLRQTPYMPHFHVLLVEEVLPDV